MVSSGFAEASKTSHLIKTTSMEEKKYSATPYLNQWLIEIKHQESSESSTWRSPKFSSFYKHPRVQGRKFLFFSFLR